MFVQAESNLARYGRLMLHSLPEETTQLLIDLCTTTRGSSADHRGEESSTSMTVSRSTLPSSTSSTGGPSYLSYLALNRGQPTTSISSDISPPSPSIKTVRQETIASGTATPPASTSTQPQQPLTTSPPQTVQPPPRVPTPAPAPAKLPSPRVYFAHFVDHMEQFVLFLETVAIRRYGQSVDESGSVADHVSTQRRQRREGTGGTGTGASTPVAGSGSGPGGDGEEREDQVAIWNTLLELYLTLPGSFQVAEGGDEAEKERDRREEELKEKAMKVLTSSRLPYDPTHALILCSTHGFIEGLVLLWEKLGMYEDIIRFWISQASSSSSTTDDDDASEKVINCLLTYGTQEGQTHLYPLVLRFLTSSPQLLVKHREDLSRILEYIEEEGIMPPLGVVQLLSRNGVASVGLVKEWLMSRIRESREEVENVHVSRPFWRGGSLILTLDHEKRVGQEFD